jgi:hypothetical protein
VHIRHHKIQAAIIELENRYLGWSSQGTRPLLILIKSIPKQ